MEAPTADKRKRAWMPELEAKLARWARRHAEDEGKRATSQEIRARATELTEEMAIEPSLCPKFSKGWVHGFKSRYGLIERREEATKEELIERITMLGSQRDLSTEAIKGMVEFIRNYDDTPTRITLTHEQKYEVCAHLRAHRYGSLVAILRWATEHFQLPAEMSTNTMRNILKREGHWKSMLDKDTIKAVDRRVREYVDGKCVCNQTALICGNKRMRRRTDLAVTE